MAKRKASLHEGIPNEVSKQKKIGTVKGKEVKIGAAVESALNVHCVDCGVKGNYTQVRFINKTCRGI
jgi:hypothetical protein